MVRVCNAISEARNRKEHIVLTIMHFESCYERIWRAGILHKAYSKGVFGKMWMNLTNFLLDRKYYIKVNEYKFPVFRSAVVIPKGSVISPVSCNLYTSDSMENVSSKHAEFADDVSIWTSDPSVSNACISLNQDLITIKNDAVGICLLHQRRRRSWYFHIMGRCLRNRGMLSMEEKH